jgi:hypothetical protein
LCRISFTAAAVVDVLWEEDDEEEAYVGKILISTRKMFSQRHASIHALRIISQALDMSSC